ncbi:ankyrin repeat domain-containing protein [Paenibacillus sedimenti]|uniref:Ankyrin repeat domain-containing protein n=1 Tax=Paenibacillus sedimenti TaxID=2770274 RepID=A0A926KPL9_9BACL|nr:ankyrin repeat domain-containing protein [Paenibacillus sedimenti]MBD0380988.1 ankyrin repeat domain-containing protein [Paenibacillus sedimenti]
MNDSICRAVATGNIEYIKFSFLRGISVDYKCIKSGHSLLNIAIENEQLEVVRFLLQNGANINLKSIEGWTPLHVAVDVSIDGTIQSGGNPGEEPTEVLKYLLDNGADKNIMACNGKTPTDIARDYNSQKIINFLENY